MVYDRLCNGVAIATLPTYRSDGPESISSTAANRSKIQATTCSQCAALPVVRDMVLPTRDQ